MTEVETRGPTLISLAACVLPTGDDLDATIRFFIDELGFRLDAIGPADAPNHARLSGHGLTLQLEKSVQCDPGVLRIGVPGNTVPQTRTAPNGTRIEFVPAAPEPMVPTPAPQASIRRFGTASSAWARGRAGMLYRDLIPDRAGGYLIASHIRIPDGGPVPDDIHHHAIRFQFIYCRRGWVRLVYEDQGEPFVLKAGDCVLQPPHIRHRVLEASDGLEVVELACPADHETALDHEMRLPTGRRLPERDYSGQTFVLNKAGEAHWQSRPRTGFETRDLGLREATQGLVDAHVLRRLETNSKDARLDIRREGAFTFLFALRGSLTIALDDLPATRLAADGSCVIPAASQVRFDRCSSDLELLEVEVSGRSRIRTAASV